MQKFWGFGVWVVCWVFFLNLHSGKLSFAEHCKARHS